MKYAFHLFYIQFVTAYTTMNGTKYPCLYFQMYCSPRKTVRNINLLYEVKRGDIYISNNRILKLNERSDIYLTSDYTCDFF